MNILTEIGRMASRAAAPARGPPAFGDAGQHLVGEGRQADRRDAEIAHHLGAASADGAVETHFLATGSGLKAGSAARSARTARYG